MHLDSLAARGHPTKLLHARFHQQDARTGILVRSPCPPANPRHLCKQTASSNRVIHARACPLPWPPKSMVDVAIACLDGWTFCSCVHPTASSLDLCLPLHTPGSGWLAHTRIATPSLLLPSGQSRPPRSRNRPTLIHNHGGLTPPRACTRVYIYFTDAALSIIAYLHLHLHNLAGSSEELES